MNPNIYKSGKNTQFSSDRQPKTQGRKQSRLIKEIKEKNISIEDVRIAFKYILDMNQLEMDKLIKDTNKPFLLRCLTKAFKADYKRGNLNNIQVILDRIFGKPKEHIEHSGKVILSKEERKARIDELLNKRDVNSK